MTRQLRISNRVTVFISIMENNDTYGFPLATIAVAACGISYLVSTYFTNGLNKHPGPILAKVSNLWYYYSVKSNHHHDHLIALHRRHGDVVRIGPNRLSIANPEYVGRIYGTQDAFPKVRVLAVRCCSVIDRLASCRARCTTRSVCEPKREGHRSHFLNVTRKFMPAPGRPWPIPSLSRRSKTTSRTWTRS